LTCAPTLDILLDIRGEAMNMHIGKWGNSLAVRLPRELVDKYNLKEGGSLPTTGLEADLETEQAEAVKARREAALAEIRKGRIVLPPDWKFDREEANWRPAMDRW
jgi:antitoxin MazE